MNLLAVAFKILTFPLVIFYLSKTERLYKKQEFEKALSTIDSYTKLYGKDSASEAYRLVILSKLKKNEACEQIIKESSARMRETTAFATAASIYYASNGDYFNAIRMTKPLLERKKHLAHHHNNMGYYYSKIDDYEKSIEHLNEVIKAKPQYAYAYNNRGYSKFKTGDIEAGLEDIEKSLELDPSNAYAYKNRGKIHMENGQKELALADFDKALQLNYREKHDGEVDELLKQLSE